MLHTTITNRGNYRCKYCKKVWKRLGPQINTHMMREHEVLVVRAEAEGKSRRLVEEVNELRRKLSVATAPKPPVTSAKKERYSAAVYCPNCRQVDNVSIVKGYAPGQSGCFRCGNTGGGLVVRVNVQPGTYEVSQ